MRRVLLVVLLALAAVFPVSTSRASESRVATSDQRAVATESTARAAALDLANKIGAYTSRSPDAPGAVEVFGAPGLRAKESLLVHSYPGIVPSYYYIIVESDRGAAFVILEESSSEWRAYGEIPPTRRSLIVERAAAAVLATGFSGADAQADDLVVVEHGNALWWHPVGGDPPVFVSVTDPNDVRLAIPLDVHTPEIVDEVERIQDISARGDHTRLPTSYEVPGVPHYYQLTNYFCGAAALEMVFDYLGPHVGQYDVSYAANTDAAILGTRRDDLLRAAHFSSMSTAFQDPTLVGYDERSLGYTAVSNSWSYEPDYSTRYSDIKELLCADHPVLTLMWFSGAHQAAHYRVVKGYDDATDVFIVHDPWYTLPYSGPDVHFNQAFFIDDLWDYGGRWGLFVAPWTSALYPRELTASDTTTVTAIVSYASPHPFGGDWEVSDATATLSLHPSLSFAPGESATKPVTGISLPGSAGTASWRVVAGAPATGLEVSIAATGIVSGTSPSYGAYNDSIGGTSAITLQVIETSPTLIAVDHAGGGDYRNIWEGIYSADDGDTILVAAGVYSGPLNRDVSLAGRDIILISETGPDSTIIDCRGAGRGLLFDSNDGPSTVVDGFTVRHGASPDNYGGGIVCIGGASPTIRNCVVSDCSASFFGGGIYCDGGSSPFLESLTVYGNSSLTGSGLYCRTGAAPVVTNCTFVANSSNQIATSDASPSISNSIMAASENGYAVVCQGTANPSITRSCIFENAQGDSLCGSYYDNIFVNPQFCDLATGVLSLHDDSPCLPAGNTWGELIGAIAAGGCGPATGIDDVLTASFSLHPARPNPSHGTISLDLSLQIPGQVDVAVYDVSGRRLRTLVNEGLPAGAHKLEWDGRDSAGRLVAAGVYFCSARLGSTEASRKMVLVR